MPIVMAPAEGRPPASRSLRVALGVVQALLAVFFLAVGAFHAFAPFHQLAAALPWALERPGLIRFIGASEMAGGLGMVLPAVTRIATWLVPLAAFGLASVMILAALFHAVRGELAPIGINSTLVMLALFVAWGRVRRAPIERRQNPPPERR